MVSAHPDDEVLAIGAWLSSQRDRDLTFVTVTDGEASHPDSPTMTADDLRSARPAELTDALHLLGIESPVIHRLGISDGEISSERETLLLALRPFVAAAGLVLGPYRHDGHPDHDAVGSALAELCGRHTTLWEFPIWTWAWTVPGTHPATGSMRCLPGSDDDRVSKRRAVAAFTTQVRPLSDDPADRAVVDGPLLEHAEHAPEVVLA